MKTLEWTTIDKTKWGPGLWQNEPDKRQWCDGATGLPCLAVRNPHSGHWCGYVGVSESHPWHSVDYGNHDESIEVHGGLTFSDNCADTGGDPSRFICHLPEPGEPDSVWWFGFDCHHGWDYAPGFAAMYPKLRNIGTEVYRDLGYVTQQCERLAKQLSEVTK